MKHEHPESKLAKRQHWHEHIESWKRSGLSQAPTLRHGEAVASRRAAELGITAAWCECADQVAFLPLRDALAKSDHRPGNFKSG